MRRIAGRRGIPALLMACACAMGTAACQFDLASPDGQGEIAETPQGESGVVIENDSELPDTYPHASYEFRFRARGGVPVLHWRLEKGALPPGMKFDDNGLLHGEPERTGEFQFTVSVRDGGNPQSAVQKAFLLRVRSALSLAWKNPAHVNGNRIEGSVDVSNTTPDDIDLTFIVMAISPNGRATAIGYQHFLLRRGTIAKELPFGETLPHGGYVVNVDAVGEVEAKNVIYRDRMETPSQLQVTVGP
jgi:putative Ig domain-containing protein